MSAPAADGILALARPWLLRRERLLVAVLALAIFLPGIAARDLWNPDEPRYAQVAREMLESGEFLVPHLNGRIYSEKPPLQFWAIAFFGWLRGGVDEVAARLPAVLSAVVATLLVFAMGRRLFDRETGWIAAAAFATGAKILWQGRIGQIDMLLIALVAAAMYFWCRGYLERRPLFFRLFFLACGFATVAKGPVGLLPPLLSIVAFSLLARRRELLREMRIGTGLLLWAAPVAAWLLPAAAHAGRAYLETMVLRQNFERYADPWHHFQPWHYYLQVLPADFFPWSLLLPGALLAGWLHLRGERRERFLWTLSWVGVTLLFFSLSPAKRTVYVLTMYPGLALALAAGLVELRRRWPRGRAWVEAPLLLLAGLAATALAALPRLATRHAEEVSQVGGGSCPPQRRSSLSSPPPRCWHGGPPGGAGRRPRSAPSQPAWRRWRSSR
ncbi:MAG: glycosyltransferase family 39 protein [Thermoanaerobaculia bacterium]|nr:glycosyltransferase family 39 protein [Thermoanaerobaculia bacterium]